MSEVTATSRSGRQERRSVAVQNRRSAGAGPCALVVLAVLAGIPAVSHGQESASAPEATTEAIPPQPGPAAGGYLFPPPPLPPLAHRSGLFFGTELGLGSTSYSRNDGGDGQGGFYFDLRLGGMLNPRTGIAAEFLSDGHRQENFNGFDAARAQNTLAITLAYWIHRRIWVRVGLGASRLSFFQEGEKTDSFDGRTFLFGIGYELMQRGKWTIDLSLRVMSSDYDDELGDQQRTSVAFNMGLARF